MLKTTGKRGLLASTTLCGAAALGLWGTGAQAQTTAAAEVSEVIVTGSRIPQPNLTSASPVTVVSQADVKMQGISRTEDLLNSLPQVMANQAGGVSNASQGIATVDLRGLGPQRTLVLIDGRRVVPGDPRNPVTDLNFIPAPLLERLEVLSGGASAVYGSDAIAGVVNFIMLKNFEGVRIDAQVGAYQHDNNNGFMQSVNAKKGFKAPTGSIWDGRQTTITLITGINSGDGKGNATAYASYRNIQPVLEAARDYSFCSLQETSAAPGVRCGGSGTTAPTHIISNDLNAQDKPFEFIVDKAGPGNTLRAYAATDTYNFAPLNYYQRPDEQYSAGVFAHYELNPHVDLYSQFMFMDDHTVSQIAPSGVFGQPFDIACNSPLLSAQQVQTLCTNAGIPATGSASLTILRRNVEGGPRIADMRHTDYRFVIGGKGALNADWSYELYAMMGRNVFAREYLNDVSLAHTAQALNATRDANGAIVCADVQARAQGCVPWNLFAVNGVTPAALAYVGLPGFQQGSTTEQVVSASITGKLRFLQSPWASDPVGIAAGTEYRRENLELRNDSEFISGDLAGQGGPTADVHGTYDVYELFGEARVPLAQDMPFAKELSLDVGYRYSDYSSAGITNTYKVEGEWAPSADVRLRGSYERAVRAPNIVELFTPPAVANSLDRDPCAGASPVFSAAQCLNSGVTAAQYGHIVANPAGQYNGLTGGNPDLAAEKADTYTAGVVLTPTMLPGFTFSADYFNIKVNNFIQPLDAGIALTKCIQSGNPTYCSLVHRDANGSLWLGQAGYVDNRAVNVGFLQEKGWDFEATYRTELARFGLDNWGAVNVNVIGTLVQSRLLNPGFTETDAAGNSHSTYDCAGYFGLTTCNQPQPKWRHRARVTWTTPVDGLQVAATWRYLGEVKSIFTSSNPFLTGTPSAFDSKLSAQSYIDLSAQYKIRQASFRIGVNNVFDKEPPLIGTSLTGTSIFQNGNTYPTVYDALGRYLFASVTVDF